MHWFIRKVRIKEAEVLEDFIAAAFVQMKGPAFR
jgi:hypothetical protein